VWTAEEGYFGLSAEVKRRMLSERTREALRYAKADGKKLGRPFGKGWRKLGVCRSTLLAFLKLED